MIKESKDWILHGADVKRCTKATLNKRSRRVSVGGRSPAGEDGCRTAAKPLVPKQENHGQPK